MYPFTFSFLKVWLWPPAKKYFSFGKAFISFYPVFRFALNILPLERLRSTFSIVPINLHDFALNIKVHMGVFLYKLKAALTVVSSFFSL